MRLFSFGKLFCDFMDVRGMAEGVARAYTPPRCFSPNVGSVVATAVIP